MEQETMKLRAHHGMCLAFFEGKGYSDEFTSHMQTVWRKMQEDPKLQIIAESDVICGKCPNLNGRQCNTYALVQRYDQQVLELTGIKEGTEIKWSEFFKLVESKILAAGKRKTICGNCQWTEICDSKEFLYKL